MSNRVWSRCVCYRFKNFSNFLRMGFFVKYDIVKFLLEV